jgi:hypothetical protein
MKVPVAYDLKRIAARHAHKIWHSELLAGIEGAPVYVFPDQTAFDSDEVDQAARAMMDHTLHLSHRRVIFEIPDRSGKEHVHVVYAQEIDGAVECVYLYRDTAKARWTDILVHARFDEPGVADVEMNPATTSVEDGPTGYATVATGIVWRALAILAADTGMEPREIPQMRRRKLARAGVTGWEWNLVSIDLAGIRAKVFPKGGTHAAPRWHIRRGHWRNLADGRRVFVRECEVGDKARGGVVKDYEVAAL